MSKLNISISKLVMVLWEISGGKFDKCIFSQVQSLKDKQLLQNKHFKHDDYFSFRLASVKYFVKNIWTPK